LLSADFFVGTPGQALQDGEDADDGTLHLNRLLAQYPGDIRVQSVAAIGGALLGYHRGLGGEISSQGEELVFLKTQRLGNSLQDVG